MPLDETAIAPGFSGDIQLVLERPIAAAAGDRFILRDVSAQRTIGGGRFLDLRAPARKRGSPERVAQRAALSLADPRASFAALLEAPPFFADLTGFARDRALSEVRARAIAEGVELLEAGDGHFALTGDRWRRFAEIICERLAAFHQENTDAQGCGRELSRAAVAPRWTPAVFRAALAKLAKEGRLAVDGGFVRLPEHAPRLLDVDLERWRGLAPRLGGDVRFRPPRIRDIASDAGEDERDLRRLFKLAGRMGWVDEIAHDHFFLRETTREMLSILRAIGEGEFSAAQFRDKLDNGRKVAIHILEFFDRHGVTLRRGDLGGSIRTGWTYSAPTCKRRRKPEEKPFPVGRSDFKSEGGSEPVSGGFDSHSPPPRPHSDR